MSSLSERLYSITKRHPTLVNKGKLAEYFGCSRSMLYNYENGNPDPPQDFLDKVTALEIVVGKELDGDSPFVQPARGKGNGRNLPFPESDHSRRIGVIGWAHAGQAAGYEELPASWQRTIPTDCRDPNAFAVMLEGDSMEPVFRDGDLLVLMPSERIHNGCIAVVRLTSDGVLLRRIEVRGKRMRLVPLNPRYEVEEMDCEQVSWAYPVWGKWQQVWK